MEPEAKFVLLEPLDQQAIPQIRVNGKVLTSKTPVQLKPNDRIAIGPSSFFVFKNRAHEDEASRPDTDEDPITFDFAEEECFQFDGETAANEEKLDKAQATFADTQVQQRQQQLADQEDTQK